MVNFRIVSKIIGQLLFLESAFMLCCVAVSVYYGEEDLFAFLFSLGVTLAASFIFKFFGIGAPDNMSRRDAYFVVTATWVAFSLFGMLPYLVGGYITDVTDAYFETMSGFTTTGVSVITSVETLPHGVLFWRSLTEWIGGLGIVFFTIAVLPSMVGGSMKVFAAEASGALSTRMHPRLSTNARWIWSVYSALTFACALAYKVAGMGLFECVNYAMATTATGGFCIHDAGLSAFGSPAIEYVCAVFQLLAGINFTLLYMIFFKGQFGTLKRSTELRTYLSVIALCTVWVMFLLVGQGDYDVSDAFRSALFHVTSFVATTGLSLDDNIGSWPRVTWMILTACMFLGACSGSAGGGLKCVRGAVLLKVLRSEFTRLLHPNAVLPVRVDGACVAGTRLTGVLTFFVAYVLLCVGVTALLVATGIGGQDALTVAIGCMTNCGPALGAGADGAMTWADLSQPVKWFCSLLMLVGRMEILSVLVLFTPLYWKDN